MATLGLVVAMLVMQACVRIMLAVKSAALPGVLHGKDLMNGNGAVPGRRGPLPGARRRASPSAPAERCPRGSSWSWAAIALVVAAVVAKRIQRMEVSPHTTTFAQEAEARRRATSWTASARSRSGRRPRSACRRSRCSATSSGVHARRVRAVRALARRERRRRHGRARDRRRAAGSSAARSAWSSRSGGRTACRRSGCCSARCSCSAPAPSSSGSWWAWPGSRRCCSVGFFAFFLGKISADTIVQQAMPDDFRGRAFALFDIAYNLGLHRSRR